jgi:hypothetical protein
LRRLGKRFRSLPGIVVLFVENAEAQRGLLAAATKRRLRQSDAFGVQRISPG